ncbi:MAG: hypothetical protein ACXWBH_10330 [Candidatus Angelobacter sp.]
MSVAGKIEKGKSNAAMKPGSDLAKYSRRPLRQRLAVLMALEIPHQQDKKENDHEHENAEVLAGSIITAPS